MFFSIYSPSAEIHSHEQIKLVVGSDMFVELLWSRDRVRLCVLHKERRGRSFCITTFATHSTSQHLKVPQTPFPCRRWVQRNRVSSHPTRPHDYFRGNSLGSSLAELMASLRASDPPLDTPSEPRCKRAAFSSDQTTTTGKKEPEILSKPNELQSDSYLSFY